MKRLLVTLAVLSLLLITPASVLAQENPIETLTKYVDEAVNYEILPVVSAVINTVKNNTIFAVVHDKIYNTIFRADDAEVEGYLLGKYGVKIPLEVKKLRDQNGKVVAYKFVIPKGLEGEFELVLKILPKGPLEYPVLTFQKKVWLININRIKARVLALMEYYKDLTSIRYSIANHTIKNLDLLDKLFGLANYIDVEIDAPDALYGFRLNAIIFNESENLYVQRFQEELRTLYEDAQIINVTIEEYLANPSKYRGWIAYIPGYLNLTKYAKSAEEAENVTIKLLDKLFANKMFVITLVQESKASSKYGTDWTMQHLLWYINYFLPTNISIVSRVADVYASTYYRVHGEAVAYYDLSGYAIDPADLQEYTPLFTDQNYLWGAYFYVGNGRLGFLSQALVNEAINENRYSFLYVIKGKVDDAQTYANAIVNWLDKLLGIVRANSTLSVIGLPADIIEYLRTLKTELQQALNGTFEGVMNATDILEQNMYKLTIMMNNLMARMMLEIPGGVFGGAEISYNDLAESYMGYYISQLSGYAGEYLYAVAEFMRGDATKKELISNISKLIHYFSFGGTFLQYLNNRVEDYMITIGDRVYAIPNITLESILNILEAVRSVVSRYINLFMEMLNDVMEGVIENVTAWIDSFTSRLQSVLNNLRTYAYILGGFAGFAVGAEVGEMIQGIFGGPTIEIVQNLIGFPVFPAGATPGNFFVQIAGDISAKVSNVAPIGKLVGGAIGAVIGLLITHYVLGKDLSDFLGQLKNYATDLINLFIATVMTSIKATVYALASMLNSTITMLVEPMKILISKIIQIRDAVFNNLNNTLMWLKRQTNITVWMIMNMTNSFISAVRQIASFCSNEIPKIYDAMGTMFNATVSMFATLNKAISKQVGDAMAQITDKVENYVLKNFVRFSRVLNEKFRAIAESFRITAEVTKTTVKDMAEWTSSMWRFMADFFFEPTQVFDIIMQMYQNPSAFFSNMTLTIEDLHRIRADFYRVESLTGYRYPAIEELLERIYYYSLGIRYGVNMTLIADYAYTLMHMVDLLGHIIMGLDQKIAFGQGLYTTYNITDAYQYFVNGTTKKLDVDVITLEDGSKIYFARPEITESLVELETASQLETASLTTKQSELYYNISGFLIPKLTRAVYKVYSEEIITGIRSFITISYPKLAFDHAITPVHVEINAIGGDYDVVLEVGPFHKSATIRQSQTGAVTISLPPFAGQYKVKVYINGKLVLEDTITILPGIITIMSALFITAVVYRYYIKKKQKKKKVIR